MKEITTAELTAGAAAYQSNERRSIPNNVQKSCKTYVTAILLKSKKERNQTLEHTAKFPPTAQTSSF